MINPSRFILGFGGTGPAPGALGRRLSSRCIHRRSALRDSAVRRS